MESGGAGGHAAAGDHSRRAPCTQYTYITYRSGSETLSLFESPSASSPADRLASANIRPACSPRSCSSWCSPWEYFEGRLRPSPCFSWWPTTPAWRPRRSAMTPSGRRTLTSWPPRAFDSITRSRRSAAVRRGLCRITTRRPGGCTTAKKVQQIGKFREVTGKVAKHFLNLHMCPKKIRFLLETGVQVCCVGLLKNPKKQIFPICRTKNAEVPNLTRSTNRDVANK